MQMNPNLILQAGQTADILGSMQRGNALAGQVNEQRRQNALAGFYRDNGAALMQGDQNALAGLAQYDPQAAFGMQRQIKEDAWRADDRQYSRGRDAVADVRLARLDERQAGLDAQNAEERQLRLKDYARKATADQLAKDRDQLRRGIQAAYGAKDDQEWDALATQFGATDLVGQFAQRDAVLRSLMETDEFLKSIGKGGTNTPSSFTALDLQARAAGLEPETPEYKDFMLTGGKPGGGDGPAAFQALHKQALAAGFEEGSPEYKQFMATRGAGLAAEATAIGRSKGEAQQALPGAYAEANYVIGLVDDLIADPYLKNMVGPVAGRTPNTSGDAARVQARMDQISGQGFLAARQFLKGQGPITDFESKRAEAAMARMSATQNYDDYVAALREFQDAVRVGVMKAEQAAGRQPTVSPSQQPATINGYKIEAIE